MMKKDITIPAHFPELKKEDAKAAAERREQYSITRDIQAREFNEAIAARLAKEKLRQE